MLPPANIKTQRLLLRQPVMKDAQSIFEQYAQDPAVTRYMSWQPHQNLKDSETFLMRCLFGWHAQSAFSWSVTRQKDDATIGMIEIRLGEHGAEMGYVLAQAHWGQGYMTEAAQHIVQWAMKEDSIHRLWATCHEENLASVKVLEKLGFKKEGTLRRWEVFPCLGDTPKDSLCYSIVK